MYQRRPVARRATLIIAQIKPLHSAHFRRTRANTPDMRSELGHSYDTDTCYVSLCEGLRAGAGSLSYIVHVDCCGLSTIVIKKIIIIIIIIITCISV